MPTLAHLRAEIAEIDARILAGMAHRLKLAEEIGRLKQDSRLPLRDYLVEREVVDRWVRGLSGAGVPAERAETLVRWVIEEAVAAQEMLPPSLPEMPGPSDVVVVGGLGRMGGWMCEYLRAAGNHVGIVERQMPAEPGPFPVTTDLAEVAGDADLIVVATSMRAAPEVYDRLLATKPDGTIFDILSIKAPLLPVIRRGIRAGLHISSVHPLFGPGTRSLFGRNLLVLDCGDAAATRTVRTLFDRTALHITTVPIDEHDPLMADVLGLPHALSLLFARSLQHGPHTPAELAGAASTSFRRIAEVAEVVIRENPELVGDIQTLNPSSEELFRRIGEALSDLAQAASAENTSAYASMLGEGRRFLERSSPSIRPGK